MSNAAKQTPYVNVNSSGWTQLDASPLYQRQYAEILNNDKTQSIGVCYTSGAAPSSEAWNTFRIVLPEGRSGFLPASASVKIYAKTEKGAQDAGATIVLDEWA